MTPTPPEIDWRITTVDSIDSTMDEMLRLPSLQIGEVLVAKEQTAGRGRSGRKWLARSGDALMFSAALPTELERSCLGRVSLGVSLSVAESIETIVGGRCQVKWPNDVVLNGRKVSGVLLQSRLEDGLLRRLVAGVGVNLIDFPEETNWPATSVRHATGTRVNPQPLLDTILNRIAFWTSLAATPGSTELVATWNSRSILIGSQVTVGEASGTVSGRFEGAGQFGQAMIRRPDGSVANIYSGDLRNRFRPGAEKEENV